MSYLLCSGTSQCPIRYKKSSQKLPMPPIQPTNKAAAAASPVPATALTRQQDLATPGPHPHRNSTTASFSTQHHADQNSMPFLQLQPPATPTAATGAGAFSSFVPVDPTTSGLVVWPPAKVPQHTSLVIARELITEENCCTGSVLCPPARLKPQQQGASGLARKLDTSEGTWNAPIITSSTAAGRNQQQQHRRPARCCWVVTTEAPLPDPRRPEHGQEWGGQFGQHLWDQGDARQAAGAAQQRLSCAPDACLLGAAGAITAAATAAAAPATRAPTTAAAAAAATAASPADTGTTSWRSNVGPNWLNAAPSHGRDQQQQRQKRQLKRQMTTQPNDDAGCTLVVNALECGGKRPMKQARHLQQTMAPATKACSQVEDVHRGQQQQQQQHQHQEQEQEQGEKRRQEEQQQKQGEKRQQQQEQDEENQQQREQMEVQDTQQRQPDTHLLRPPAPAPQQQQQQSMQLPQGPPQSWEAIEHAIKDAIEYLQHLLPVMTDKLGWPGSACFLMAYDAFWK